MIIKFLRIFIWALLCFSTVQALEPLDFYKIIKKVDVKGLSQVSLSQLPLSSLMTQPYKKITQEGLSKDVSQLYLTGYFNEVKVAVAATNNQLVVSFLVKENPVIRDIQITGATAFSTSQLMAKLSSRAGTVLNMKVLSEDKTALETLYKTAGYSFFKVRSMGLTSQNILAIKVSEGVIETLDFTGLRNVQPFVIWRELLVKPGEPFNATILREEREHLLKIGYFSDISLPQIELNDDETKVRVTFNVTEKKINLIDVGFEQQDNQVVFFLQNNWNHTFIQHADLLITKFRVSNDLDKPFQFNLRYTQPWMFNRYPISFTADAWTENREEFLSDDTDTLLSNRRRGAALAFAVPLVRDRLTFTTRAKYESVQPEDGADFTAYQIHSLSASLADRQIDNAFNPKRGYYWSAEYEKGGDLLGLEVGGLHFSRTTLQVAAFLGLSDKSVLAFHPIIGLFNLQESSISTFETESFSLGGATSLRGYKETAPFIGDREIALNVEYRYDFSTTLQGVLFFDIGRVFGNDESFFSQEGYYIGKGFGLRFMTPIGPIRTDFSWGDTMMIIHFGIGQVF